MERQTPKTMQKPMPIKPVGAGKLRKKTLSTKVKETFLSTDLPDVKTNIVKSIIVPQAKNMVLDAIRSVATGVVGTAEMMLFGRVTRGLSDVRRGGSVASGVRYNTISSSPTRTLTPQQRTSFSIESIEFEGIKIVDGIARDPWQQAQAVIDSMKDHIEMYERATVRDLYDYAGVTTYDFTESYYGWYSFATARPESIAGGKCIIVCPKPEYLGERK